MSLTPSAWFLLALVAVCNLQAAVESRFVSLGELRLHYADWGGDGEPLVFVPGGCDSAFVSGDLAARLVSRFRVVGLTGRGCGASDRPASGYDMGHQIEDLLGFMNALGLQQATLIAHSSGGGKITQFALRHPGRVHRLIYLDTVFRYVAPGLEEKIAAAIGRAFVPDAVPLRAGVSAQIYYVDPKLPGFQIAPVQYAGSAPTLASGIVQINFEVPVNVAPGAFSFSPAIDEHGTILALTGATIAVK